MTVASIPGHRKWRRSKSDLKIEIAAHQRRMLKAFITDVHENKPKSPNFWSTACPCPVYKFSLRERTWLLEY
jgi:hypothetical protein